MTIDEIKKQLSEITPGWEARTGRNSVSVYGRDYLLYQTIFIGEIEETRQMHRNAADFIASAPDTIRQLVAALENACDYLISLHDDEPPILDADYWLEQAAKELNDAIPDNPA